MTKPIRIFLLTVGVLSIISGIYLFIEGSDLIEFISAFVAGVGLIVGVLYFDKNPDPDPNL